MTDFAGLTHTYGEAADIRAKLDALEALPSRWEEESLGSLWGAL